MMVHSYRPISVIMAVFSILSGAIGMYAQEISSLLKIFAPANWLLKSKMLGTGYQSGFIIKFNERQSPQTRH